MEKTNSLFNVNIYCLNCKSYRCLEPIELFISCHKRYYAKGSCLECGKNAQRMISRETYIKMINDEDTEIQNT